MMLLTKAIKLGIPALYSTEETPTAEKRIAVKFFTPDSQWTWYVTEGNPEGDGDYRFFGLVDGMEKEWGYFLLSELESIRGPLGLAIERDRHFGNPTIGEAGL